MNTERGIYFRHWQIFTNVPLPLIVGRVITCPFVWDTITITHFGLCYICVYRYRLVCRNVMCNINGGVGLPQYQFRVFKFIFLYVWIWKTFNWLHMYSEKKAIHSKREKSKSSADAPTSIYIETSSDFFSLTKCIWKMSSARWPFGLYFNT